jgi:hypothetical protein
VYIGALLLAVGVVALGWFGWGALTTRANITGLRAGEVASPTNLSQRDIAISLKGGNLSTAKVRLNGQPLTTLIRANALHVQLPVLVDGKYQLSVTSSRRPFGSITTTRRFVVDGTPPAIRFQTLNKPVPIDRRAVLKGTVRGATKLSVPGATVSRDGDAVTLTFARPPAGPVEMTAIDGARNTAKATLVVPVAYPKTNGVHVSATAWTNPLIKAEILGMIAQKRINTVELDLKDESGVVGYDSQVPLAKQIGALRPSYDIRSTVAQLHALHVRVVGRIVAFSDPILTRYAWNHGHKDWVLQDPQGERFKLGGFSNYVSPAVQDYNLAIAREAAQAGFNDILWDYVRRPDGPPTAMVVPGLKGSSSVVIADFLRRGHEMLRSLGVYQGASVFGISATRPQTIAQDIPLFAQHVDYIAPMLYPERWTIGEYGVPDPQAQPYDIVYRSLADFRAAVAPMGRALVPWLQDYSKRVAYGPPEVHAQMKAAHDRGVNDWLFWNLDGVYNTSGYPVEH